MQLLRTLLLLGSAACNEAGPDAETFAADACGELGSVALTLAPRASQALADSAAPTALVLLPDGSLIMADRSSSGVSLDRPGSTEARWVAAPEPLSVLVLAPGEVLGAGITTIYRIDTESGRVERLMEVPVRAGRIVSLAADARTVWVGTAHLPAGAGAVYAAPRDRPDAWRHTPMEAPVRLESVGDGRAAAALTRAPHRLFLLDPVLHSSGSAAPPGRPGRDRARFTQALITLDCGRLLHVISDLRSDRRELHIYQTTPEVRLIRSRTIEQPIGFVHALGGRSVVAVAETGMRREVVLFGWSWLPTQEGT